MATSGIEPNADCEKQFGFLQGRKKVNDALLKYIVFKINSDKTEVVVEKISSETDYEKFLEELPEDDCRYAVYDFHFDLGDAGTRDKPVFISWAPDTLTGMQGTKLKTLYSSTRSALLRKLSTIGSSIHATDLDDISYDAVKQRVARG